MKKEFEQFYLFLVTKGILFQFIQNMRQCNRNFFVENMESLQRYEAEVYIAVAFEWRRTPEGTAFWLEYSSKWEKKYNGHIKAIQGI